MLDPNIKGPDAYAEGRHWPNNGEPIWLATADGYRRHRVLAQHGFKFVTNRWPFLVDQRRVNWCTSARDAASVSLRLAAEA